MPKIRNFDKILNSFVNQLCISTGIDNIVIDYKSSPNIVIPSNVCAQEVSFILLTRIAHFIAVEVDPNYFESIKQRANRLLTANQFNSEGWNKEKAIKYFLELFGSRSWAARDLTRKNAANSGANHLVLLGDNKEDNWFSLKLNRYKSLSKYSLMIGYKNRALNIYKFGLKH